MRDVHVLTEHDLRDAVGLGDDELASVETVYPLISTGRAVMPPITLRPGLHVTAVGSDAEHKPELHAGVVDAADRVVCDHVGQSCRLGELRAAVAAGCDAGRAVPSGAVIDGTAEGRTSGAQVTICDLTGPGAQDTAIATLAVRRCVAAGTGIRVAT